jgi:GntR family transcriptional regulator
MKAVSRHGDWQRRTDAKVPAPAGITARLGIDEGDLCVRTSYESLADAKPVQLSMIWQPYDPTAGTLVLLPRGGRMSGQSREPHGRQSGSPSAMPWSNLGPAGGG